MLCPEACITAYLSSKIYLLKPGRTWPNIMRPVKYSTDPVTFPALLVHMLKHTLICQLVCRDMPAWGGIKAAAHIPIPECRLSHSGSGFPEELLFSFWYPPPHIAKLISVCYSLHRKQLPATHCLSGLRPLRSPGARTTNPVPHRASALPLQEC